jgi:hypothetical protein
LSEPRPLSPEEAQLKEQCERAIKEALRVWGLAEKEVLRMRALTGRAQRRIKAIVKWRAMLDAMLAQMEADPELQQEAPDLLEAMRDLREKFHRTSHPAEVVYATRIAASRAARARHARAPRSRLQEAVDWAKQAAASGQYSKHRAALAAAATYGVNPDTVRRLLYHRKHQ